MDPVTLLFLSKLRHTAVAPARSAGQRRAWAVLTSGGGNRLVKNLDGFWGGDAICCCCMEASSEASSEAVGPYMAQTIGIKAECWQILRPRTAAGPATLRQSHFNTSMRKSDDKGEHMLLA